MLVFTGCSTLPDVSPVKSGVGGPAKTTSTLVPLFIVSTRKAETERAQSSDLARDTRFLVSSVSIPPGHQPGVIEQPSFGSPNKASHFVFAGQRDLDEQSFKSEIAMQISGRVGVNRDVLVYVHGFNTGYDEARFRLAQIVEDSDFTGIPVLFTWPSRNKVLAYGADKESATASRDALEQALTDLSETAGIGRIHILAHSMGTWLTMEAMRQRAMAGQANLNGKIGEIMLAAPDIDLDVFRSQLARVGKVTRISLFASTDDRALSLSSVLAGDRQRLGALDLTNPKHREEITSLGVRVYDLTGSDVPDFFKHGTFAEAPSVVRSIGMQLAESPLAEQQPQAYIDQNTDSSPALKMQ